jgi:hypothetical protein
VRKSQPNYGGGVLLGAKYSNAGAPTTPNRTQIQGDVSFVDSTIAGNTADHGAGASIGTNDKVVGDIGGKGSISFDNSTIASNSARQAGGGIYLSSYNSGDDPAQVVSSTIPLASTIVADNTANGSPEDLNRAADSTAGGFDLAFSLVENPGNAPLTQDPNKPSTTGQDPQLGALGNNGGLTQTELPAITSPVIDKGHAPNRLKFDQRGVLRSIQVDTIADALNGDATDIGAVERPASDFPPAQKPAAKDKPPVAVIKRLHLDPSTGALSVGGGTAKDDGRVVKVQYELMRKKGNKCMVLTVNGFSGWQTCKKPTAWRTAKGTNKWSVNFNRKFASGYYVLYARATDDVGLVQKKPARATFRIKGARAARRVSPRFTG